MFSPIEPPIMSLDLFCTKLVHFQTLSVEPTAQAYIASSGFSIVVVSGTDFNHCIAHCAKSLAFSQKPVIGVLNGFVCFSLSKAIG